MRILSVLMVLVGLCVVTFAEKAPPASPARFTAKVIDENGRPLEGMKIEGGFYSEEPRQSGKTDSNGLFVVECKRAMLGEGGFSVNHNILGYYETHSGCVLQKIVDGRWEPWNTVITAVVRRVVNPIPMYAKRIETDLPLADQPVGYDLVIGDWIAPHGKGANSDFVFMITKKRVVSWTDFDASLSLSFSNKNDGVQKRDVPVGGSSFHWPYNAPENGYGGSWQVSVGYVPGKGYFTTNESTASFFRIRTVTNEQGKTVSAYYGKIPGPIKFDVRDTKTGWLQFTYYLNPMPNDRNLEFDPSKNLFKDLKDSERVSEP